MPSKRYDYNTFKELFDSQIHYAYEGQYGVDVGEGHFKSGLAGIEYVSFYKLTVYSNGDVEYKGHISTFDPRLWPKVKLLAEMLQETPAEKILFKAKPEIDEP